MVGTARTRLCPPLFGSTSNDSAHPLTTARMLPHDAGNKPRLAARRLDVLFQKAVWFFSDIPPPRKGPGPAFIVIGAGRLAGFVALTAFEIKTAIVAAEPVDRGFDRPVARLDHAGAAHARHAAGVFNAGRHAVLEPADRAAGSIVRIVEAPGPAAPIP